MSNTVIITSLIAAAVFGGSVQPYQWAQVVQRTSHYGLPSDAVIIAMLSVAMQSGLSMTRALRVIAQLCEYVCGLQARPVTQYIQHVCAELERGNDWETSWGIDTGTRTAHAVMNSAHKHLILTLYEALEASWKRGISPIIRLDAALERMESASKQQVEEAAAVLSVRVLLPVGLCFLPAFILIGIVPAIASFAGG